MTSVQRRLLSILAGCALAGILAGTGCASRQDLSDPFSVPPENIVLAEPATVDSEHDQYLIAQLSQMVDEKLDPQERAEIYYEMGIIYDRMGLTRAARAMFMNALMERPDYADVYNFLGIYYVSAGMLSEAYEVYDSALEVDPASSYTYFNRAIALYYGNRAALAMDDIAVFYAIDPDDPYRQLWYFLIDKKANGSAAALQRLKRHYEAAADHSDWAYRIIEFYLGLMNEPDFIATLKDKDLSPSGRAERLCEAYFYLGKQKLAQGQVKLAYDYFHLCVATRVCGFLEYRYAQLEISRLRQAAQGELLAPELARQPDGGAAQ